MSERDLLGLTASDRQFIKYLVGLGKATGLLPEQVRKGRPAIPRRVRKAARFCETIADTYGVYVPNEPMPERLLKADPIKKVKPHFTNTEIREMGLKWVTVHPNNAEPGKPVLVQDLGDEYVVVGGAGGSMNFTRFKKDNKDADKAKKYRKKREKPELSEEERAKQEAKLAEATDQTKKAKRELRERVSEIIGGVPDISDDERKELEAKAIAEAKRLNTSEAGQKDFVQQALEQHEQRRKEAVDKAIDDAISAVNEAAGVEALTGQPAEPPTVSAAGDGKAKPAKLPFTPEQFTEIKSLVAEEANAIGYERSLKRALNKGGEAAARALELHYKPLSAEEQSRYFADRHLEAEKIRANKALLDATSDPNSAMTKHVLQGAADAGAGLAAAACGSTVLDSKTAQELGTAGAAQVIAQYIAEKTGSPDKAAAALREFIGTQSAATAGAAVKASMELADRADAMIEAAKGQGLLNAAQANAKVLQYRNEADRILGRALGSLETAAQVALHLERGTPAKLVVPGRSSEAGTLNKARELGLVNTADRLTHSVRKGESGWELHITPEGIRDLYHEQDIEQYQADAEVQEIKRRSWDEGWEDEQGNPWSVEGQSDDIILQPHQQGNIKLWDRQKNILITDEAGSGKTAVALCGIAHLAAQGKVKKALVVVPATVGAQFGDEIKKFLAPEHHDSYAVTSGMARKQREAAYAGDQLITVITHDALRNDFEAIKAAGFDCMAVDEAHYFTTRGEANDTKGSLRSQKARELNMPYKMLMSVAGDSVLHVRWPDGTHEVISIEDMASRFGMRHDQIIEDDLCEVRSYDPATQAMCWAPVYAIQKYACRKRTFRISTRYGHSITVTEDHSVYVVRGRDVLLVNGSDVQKGDKLLLDTSMDDEGVSCLDLREHLPHEKYTAYGDYADAINAHEKGWRRYNYLNQSPAGPYLPLSRASDLAPQIIPGRVASTRGKGNHSARCIVPVTAIAYLVGLVAGDGWIGKDRRLGIAVATKDIQDATQYLDGLKEHFDLAYDTRPFRGCVNIRISSRPLGDLFWGWFGGQRAHTKRLPPEVFSWSNEAKSLVLRGLADSDGHYEEREPGAITYTTTSKMLTWDIRELLKAFGQYGRYYESRHGEDARPAFRNHRPSHRLVFHLPCAGDRQQNRVERSRERRQAAIDHIESGGTQKTAAELLGISQATVSYLLCTSSPVQGAIAVPVREIEECHETTVYDLSVRHSETFVANGLVVHNTGTPVKNDLSELHSLADWLQPGCLGTRKEFMARYGKLATGRGMFDEGLKRSLQQRLSGVATGITLSIEKDEGGKTVFELRPGKAGAEPIRCREHTLTADLSPQQAEAYRTTEKAYLDARKAGQKVNPLARDREHKRTVNNLETTDHPKVGLLRDALANHPGERAVIFAHNGFSHKTIIDGLGLQEGEYAVINADVSSAKRNAIAKQLADPNSPIKHVICSDAANFGLNMQGASVLVNWDATDTYACHRQRIAREFRNGQTRDVTVYNIRTNTPYEKTAQERIESKKKQQDLTQSLVALDESGLYSIFAEHLGGA